MLDQLLGVSSKIITVAKGSELPSRAREIAHHFDTQGARRNQCPFKRKVPTDIVTVAKGSELPSRARETAHQFDTQGATHFASRRSLVGILKF